MKKIVMITIIITILLIGSTCNNEIAKPENNIEEKLEDIKKTITDGSRKDLIIDGSGRISKELKVSVEYKNKIYEVYQLADFENRLIVFKKEGNESKAVFDVENIETIEMLDGYIFLNELYVEDLDEDGLEELYLMFEDVIGPSKVLVLHQPEIIENGNGYYINTFFDYEENTFSYLNVDGEGKKELISQHPGGGGYTTTWQGLELINKWNGQQYEFSYDLTRQYHKEKNENLEDIYLKNITIENFLAILNNYADLGDVEEVEIRIENVLEIEEFGFLIDEEIAGVPYKNFLINRAKAYKIVWEELEGR